MRIAWISPGRSPWRNWIGDRLTAIWIGFGQDAASRQASRSIHSPIEMMRPLSSASGMKAPGEIRPRLG